MNLNKSESNRAKLQTFCNACFLLNVVTFHLYFNSVMLILKENNKHVIHSLWSLLKYSLLEGGLGQIDSFVFEEVVENGKLFCIYYLRSTCLFYFMIKVKLHNNVLIDNT